MNNVPCTPKRARRNLLPLEKTGWLERVTSGEGARSVRLRAPGRRLLAEALETAEAVCAP